MFNTNISAMKAKDGDVMLESDITSQFNAIYDSTHKPVLAFITARCANTSEISDIFQETYMELYQLMSKRGAEYVTDGKALVFRIAKQKIARYYSLFKRLQMFVSMTAKDRDNDNEEAEFSDSEADIFLTEESVINQIMLDNIKHFIKTKPEDVKKVFYLFYDMDMSIPEIAKELSLSESNVKNKLYRTIKELQKLLK